MASFSLLLWAVLARGFRGALPGEATQRLATVRKACATVLPSGCPYGLQTSTGMMIDLNKSALLQASTVGGVWVAATTPALAHLRPDLQPPATNELLDVKLEHDVLHTNWRHNCHGVLPKHVTNLPGLKRMHPMRRSTYKQSPWVFRDSKGAFSLSFRGQVRWDEIFGRLRWT